MSKAKASKKKPTRAKATPGVPLPYAPFFFMNPADFPQGFLPGNKTPPPTPSLEAMKQAQAYVDPSRLLSTQLFVPYNPSVLVTRKGLSVFDSMVLDAQVKAALEFKVLAILAGGWEIQSPEDEEEDWEVTEFVRDVFTHFPGGWNSALTKMLRSLRHGYSVLEKVYAEREKGPLKGKLALDRLIELKPHYVDFETDSSGKVEAILQMPVAGGSTRGSSTAGGQDSFRHSPLKFVHVVHDKEYENPYGKSDLEAAYLPWWVKDNAYKWFAILLERFGIPPLFAMYNPNEYQGASLEDLKRVVKNIQAATMGIIPRGSEKGLEFWSQNIAAGSREIFTAALARFDADIAKALLQPSLIGFAQESGSQGAQSGGSLARSNTSWKAFLYVVRAKQVDLEDGTVNPQIIPQLCDLNFPNLKSYPIFKFARLDEEKELELFKLWSELVTGKVVGRLPDDERHIRKSLGMPDNPDPKVEPLPTDADRDQKDKLERDKMDSGDSLERDRMDREDERSERAAKAAAKAPQRVPKEDLTEEMAAFAEANDAEWVLLEGHPVCYSKAELAAWDESQHPRHPKGSGDKGGEFAPKGGGSSISGLLWNGFWYRYRDGVYQMKPKRPDRTGPGYVEEKWRDVQPPQEVLDKLEDAYRNGKSGWVT